jgi:Glycosyl-hydrolase 97 N-terminal
LGLSLKVGQAVWPVLLFCALSAEAQDLQTLKSPDGNLEFHLFVSESPSTLPRIGYQLFYKGTVLLDTSYLGFDIQYQEPILGEKAGLMNYSAGPSTLIAHYMQDGSLGRLIDIEAKIWNGGVAFRYVIPKSTPLTEIQILSELTEFALPVKIPDPPPQPFAAELPGGTWVAIGEQGAAGAYPAMALIRQQDEPKVLITHFPKLWESTTPLTTPWRVIGVGPTRQAALDNRRIKGEY